jgi:hypothetical protein
MDQLVREKELQIADLKKAEAAMAKALEEAQSDDEAMEQLIAKKDTELKRLDAERKELAKQLKEARADDVCASELSTSPCHLTYDSVLLSFCRPTWTDLSRARMRSSRVSPSRRRSSRSASRTLRPTTFVFTEIVA